MAADKIVTVQKVARKSLTILDSGLSLEEKTEDWK